MGWVYGDLLMILGNSISKWDCNSRTLNLLGTQAEGEELNIHEVDALPVPQLPNYSLMAIIL